MSIPCVISGHLQKLGKKMDTRKVVVENWKNGVGERIEKKLQRTLEKIESVVQVQMYSHALGEYSVRLTNNRCLVVKLSMGTYSCKWWQV